MLASPYDAIAEWYDGWVGDDPAMDDPVVSAVDALMGAVAGMRVCDLGCGQGRIARHLAGRGARVAGIDLSSKLLTLARRRETAAPRGISYIQADAQAPAPIADGAFDGVLCYMALMDIPDLAPALGSVARILRPGGWFILRNHRAVQHE